jgi:glycerophosphoryl diester phosphodiesterase
MVAGSAPPLYAALLTGGAEPATIDRAAALDLAALHAFYSGTTAEEIALAHARDLQVNLWTVNTRRYLAESLAKRPDAIITDDPGVLTELREEFNAEAQSPRRRAGTFL